MTIETKKPFGYNPAKSLLYSNCFTNLLNEKIQDSQERIKHAKNIPDFQKMPTLEIQKWVTKYCQDHNLPFQIDDVLNKVVQNMFGSNTTITNTTFTTLSTKFKNWGIIDFDNNLVIYQIDKDRYIYNQNGDRGLTEVRIHKKAGQRKPIYYLDIKGEEIQLPHKPKQPLHKIPRKESIEKYIIREYNPLSFKEIFEKTKRAISTLYDFKFPEDVTTTALYITQTWLSPVMQACFHLGIDATKGGGKTTLLEIIKKLSRNGLMVGDISSASIPRIKELFDISFCIDELDQLNPQHKEVIVGLMRKAQRRKNYYVRLNKNTLDPEAYEGFGTYAYSYRQDVEDALKQRTIKIHTSETRNKHLPIINYYQDLLLTEIYEDFFFWFIDEIIYFGSKSSQVVKVEGTFTRNANIEDLRIKLYNEFTKQFSKEELEVFNKLYGRNIELSFILMSLCKIVDLELHKEIKKLMDQKQEDEDVPDNYYLERLTELIKTKILQFREMEHWKLSKGDFANCFYYPKTALYRDFINILKLENINTIGTPRFNGLLRDLGFVENYNLKNQKHYLEKTPLKCCIFNKDILKKIDIEDKINLDEVIIQAIKQADDGEGVGSEFLLNYINDTLKDEILEEELQASLRSLKEKGDIIEINPDKWKILE